MMRAKTKPKVLIVDDEQDLAMFLKDYISDDFKVEVCTSGLEAKELIETKSFDMVLTDINMPDFDGLQLIAHLRRFQPDTPVVMLSGYDKTDPLVRESFALGACGLLAKPFSEPEEIVAYLIHCYEEQSEPIAAKVGS